MGDSDKKQRTGRMGLHGRELVSHETVRSPKKAELSGKAKPRCPDSESPPPPPVE